MQSVFNIAVRHITLTFHLRRVGLIVETIVTQRIYRNHAKIGINESVIGPRAPLLVT